MNAPCKGLAPLVFCGGMLAALIGPHAFGINNAAEGAPLAAANPSPLAAPSVPATAPAATAPATRTAEQKKQDDINRVMEFFRLTQPDVYEQAKTLRQSDQGKFEKLIMGAMPTVNRLETTRRHNPHLFDLSMQDLQLNYQSLRIAHELKSTDLAPADRKNLVDQLKTIVAAEFDIQQQIHQAEIEDLKQKIKDLDNQVHARADDKANIIGKRVDDLIERNPHLDW